MNCRNLVACHAFGKLWLLLASCPPTLALLRPTVPNAAVSVEDTSLDIPYRQPGPVHIAVGTGSRKVTKPDLFAIDCFRFQEYPRPDDASGTVQFQGEFVCVQIRNLVRTHRIVSRIKSKQQWSPVN